MLHWRRISLSLILLFAAVLAAQSRRTYGPGRIWWEANRGSIFPASEDYDNPDGLATVLNTDGLLETSGHPFFAALGSNHRACITCHQPSNAMSLSVESLRQRWQETQGQDAVFAAIDGSNCPSLPQDQMASHSLLLSRGLIRIFMPLPKRANFRLEVVSDPTGCNTPATISVFRRPRMVANFKYTEHPELMADGREPSLESQAITAALTHEQSGHHPTVDQLRQIVAFEKQVFVAQSADDRAGLLNEENAPRSLGINNVAEGRSKFSSFQVWPATYGPPSSVQVEFRDSVARGSQLFSQDCAACHRDGAQAVNIGTTNTKSPDLPLFRVTCNSDDRVIYTQDPGRALVTGKCSDVGAMVPQQLRGLSARAPYFTNGSAATLRDVVEFYDRRSKAAHYSEQQKRDLVNFLRCL